MKKMFLFLTAVAFIACNSKKEGDKKETKDKTSMNMSGYAPTYSSSFEIGDNKNVETVMALWKAFDDNQLDSIGAMLADSMEMYFADGNMMIGPRDSAVAGAKYYRGMYSSVKSTVHAVMPLRSTDMDEHWVCVWGTEVHTMNDKTDSIHLQETWRFNKDGKATLMYQYARTATPSNK